MAKEKKKISQEETVTETVVKEDIPVKNKFTEQEQTIINRHYVGNEALAIKQFAWAKERAEAKAIPYERELFNRFEI